MQMLDLEADAEGAEQQVLLGARKVLEKYRPIIQLEVTINDIDFPLTEYSVFQKIGSPNKVFIPNESEKMKITAQEEWKKVAR